MDDTRVSKYNITHSGNSSGVTGAVRTPRRGRETEANETKAKSHVAGGLNNTRRVHPFLPCFDCCSLCPINSINGAIIRSPISLPQRSFSLSLPLLPSPSRPSCSRTRFFVRAESGREMTFANFVFTTCPDTPSGPFLPPFAPLLFPLFE